MQPLSGEEVSERTVGTAPSNPLDTDDLRSYEPGPEEELHSGLDLNTDGGTDSASGRLVLDLKSRKHSPDNIRRLRMLAVMALLAMTLTAGSLFWLIML